MNPSDDRSYFAQREQAARRLARQADDPAARRAHAAMADAYHRRQREIAREPSEPVIGRTTRALLGSAFGQVAPSTPARG